MDLYIYTLVLALRDLPLCPRQRTPAPLSLYASRVLVTHHRCKDEDRLTVTKTVVLEYLGRGDVYTHM